jgi:hypothetical protein
MKKENFWTKISGADRLTKKGFPYDDVAPFARRLAEIAPGGCSGAATGRIRAYSSRRKCRMMGNCWMQLHGFFRTIMLKKILVENPERLLNAPAG